MSKYKELDIDFYLLQNKDIYCVPIDIKINDFYVTDVFVKEIDQRFITIESVINKSKYNKDTNAKKSCKSYSKVEQMEGGPAVIARNSLLDIFTVSYIKGEKIKIRPSKAQKKRDKQKKKDIKKAKEKIVLDSFDMFCKGLLTHKEYESVLDSIIEKSEEDDYLVKANIKL